MLLENHSSDGSILLLLPALLGSCQAGGSWRRGECAANVAIQSLDLGDLVKASGLRAEGTWAAL